jgi:hypothetical protein
MLILIVVTGKRKRKNVGKSGVLRLETDFKKISDFAEARFETFPILLPSSKRANKFPTARPF